MSDQSEQWKDEILAAPAVSGAPEKNVPAFRRTEKPSGLLSSLYDLADILVSAVLVITVLFLFLFRFAGVVGPSMQPTLHDKDWLAVSAFDFQPRPGEIVIITQPNRWHEPLVKRVVAVAGQTVDIRDGQVFVNDELLEETYLPADVSTYYPSDTFCTGPLPLKVPDGYVFVMGDNRTNSTDSRYREIGFIRCDYILGKVRFRLWPLGNFQIDK
ncbi:MAG: signal peptidase I [Oscillospiraceae bacterium]|jgi:signal peptidase I|nr:signal peptidase I [Oscillospiraceae bacterium]